MQQRGPRPPNYGAIVHKEDDVTMVPVGRIDWRRAFFASTVTVMVVVTLVGIFSGPGVSTARTSVAELANVQLVQSRRFATVCGEAKVGDKPLVLQCPKGQVVRRVDFASFGTPLVTKGKGGSCSGQFSVSKSCNAAVSVDVVQQMCLGKKRCTVSPSTQLFGEPCKGVAKSVAVKATCGAPEGGKFQYVGCYTHDDRAQFSTFLDAPATWDECNKEAASRGARFFVLESPHGNTGKAKCGFGGDYTGFMKSGGQDFSGTNKVSDLQVADEVCQKRRDKAGHALGALFKMAVYEAQTDVRGKKGFTHAWAIDEEAGWDVCKPGCGTSTKARQVVCLRSDGNVVDDHFCDKEQRPTGSLPCSNYDKCKYEWHEGGFTSCAPGCGKSKRMQAVVCWRMDLEEVAEDRYCKGPKPKAEVECTDYSLCDYDWAALTDFTGCEARCGSGTERRRVECRRSGTGADSSVEKLLPASDVAQMQAGVPTGNITLDAVPRFNCLAVNKPKASQECWDFSGCEYEWVAYEWSKCDAACGAVGVQTRQVECMRGNPEGAHGKGKGAANTEVDKSLCKSQMPQVQKYCTNDAQCTFKWKQGKWGGCPRGCGPNRERRANTCVRSDGTRVHDNYCEGNGWRQVAQELADGAGALAYLGVQVKRQPAKKGQKQAAYNEAPALRFGKDYDDVLITSGPNWYRMRPAADIFGPGAAPTIPLLAFETNDNRVSSWVEDAGGAVFCKAASKAGKSAPGGTSWAILPAAKVRNTQCGCSGGNGDPRDGNGVFYSGVAGVAKTKACPAGGGGFVGAAGDGEKKAGPALDTLKIFVRKSEYDVVTKKNDGAVDCNTYCATGWNEEAAEGSTCVRAVDTGTNQLIPCFTARGVGPAPVKCYCDEPETSGDKGGEYCAGSLQYVAGNGYLYAKQNLLVLGGRAGSGSFSVPGTRFLAKDSAGKTVFGPATVNSVQVKLKVNEFGDQTWVTWDPAADGTLGQDYDKVDVYVHVCAAAPVAERACESRAGCTYTWSTPKSWDDASIACSSRCGMGKKTRTVQCQIADPGSPFRGEKADDKRCDPIDDPKYLSVPCFDDSACVYEWYAAPWQKDHCAAACGPSTMPRVVSCERRAIAGDHGSAVASVEGKKCAKAGTTRPDESKKCYSTAKCSYKWRTGEWGACKAGCGASIKRRDVWCQRSDKVKVGDAECTADRAGQRPEGSSECMSYLTCSYAWHVSDGSKPQCDDGIRNGNEEGVDCGGSCPDCVVDGGWGNFGAWSQCSTSCGYGVMTATRRCDSPAPSSGGKPCKGSKTLTKPCKVKDCSIDFEQTKCTFAPMDAPLQFKMSLRQGKLQTVTTIPVGASQVYIRVKSSADIDLDLKTQDGEALISASDALHWGSSQFRQYGMSIAGCTDNCRMPLSLTYRGDSKEHSITSTNDFNDEYVFIQEVTVPLVLKVSAFENGEAVVFYGYDCAAACDKCTQRRLAATQ